MHTIDINDNGAVATDGDRRVVVDGGKAFNRRAIRKNLKTGETEHLFALVGELDGVRIYVIGDGIIMTKEDLRL